MRKIRILLVNNPTTALFMAAWFRQNDLSNATDWRTVPLFNLIDFDETYSANIEAKKRIEEASCREVMKTVSGERLVSIADSVEAGFALRGAGLMDLLTERERKRRNLARIKRLLADASISQSEVREIWVGNNGLSSYFSYLCPQAEVVQFEHGLSDVRNALLHSRRPRLEWRKPGTMTRTGLRNWIHDRLVIFEPRWLRVDQYVSLFGEEIKAGNPACPVVAVDAGQVLNVAECVMDKDPCHAVFEALRGNSALILLDRVKSWARSQAEHLAFFESFEQHLCNRYSIAFMNHRIENLIFKSRLFHEEFSKEAFDGFSRLGNNYRILFLSDYSPRNFPAEFYHHILKPTVILGSYSSGLFFAKKMLPSVTTYSCHRWFAGYCTRYFGETYSDYAWLEALFHGRYAPVFKQLLPVLEMQDPV